MSPILALRLVLVATILGIFAMFYSMGAAYTGFGRFLAAYGVAVLLSAGIYSGYSKLTKAAAATLLLLAGLLPFGLGDIEWETWLVASMQLAGVAAFVVWICPTYSPKRGLHRPST
ncbi:MAG: hypothetical protein CVT77_16335 [Alphaproteobacteria bacterium HGW-Alphaproteobacteria-16]|nr:MAG: hypothetical protein CVT77_16335 [Alphaproteobacteria bacterium HGW-Alphaproteobacteria-16]